MFYCSKMSGSGPQRAVVRLLLATLVFVGVGAERAEPSTVTLSTLVTRSFQELHRYAESVLGKDVIRSAAEVQRGGGSCQPYSCSPLGLHWF